MAEPEPASDDEFFVIELTDVLDLHSVLASDVEGVVEAYLEEAHARGWLALRIIHGRGIGVRREIVRKVLSRTSFVAAFADAPAEAGGWGATLVTLSNTKT
jgi:dsDNA-specific endonuclease/ATPase MutS2